MGMDWYNAIALRNGGYRSNAKLLVEGISGEDVFEQELIAMLPGFEHVLDAGCGHGDFTRKMSPFAKSLVGFDNAIEMIRIANAADAPSASNLAFVYATTKEELPFRDNQFDLIYNRRGPTSILNHSRILRPQGTVFGIHSGAMALIQERLHSNGFQNIEIREFSDARFIFPDREAFIAFLSGIPGNPNYSDGMHEEEAEAKLAEHTVDGIIQLKEYKFIWKGTKL